LFEFFDYPAALPFRVDVFERFVRDFESKINKLRLAEMGVKVAKDIDSAFSFFVLDWWNWKLTWNPFNRPSNPPEFPHIARLTDRHGRVERGTCFTPCIHRSRETALWRP
jgi:hypothetical protein